MDEIKFDPENITRYTDLAITLNRLDRRIKRAQAVVAGSPGGSLQSFTKGSRRYFIIRSFDAEGRQVSKYLRKDDVDTIRQMAFKDYCIKLVPLLQRMRDGVKAVNYDPEDAALKQLPAWEADLVRELRGTRKEFIEEWQAEPYEMNPKYEEFRTVETLRGELVRSKSEKEIANELYRAGIPYKVDAKVATADCDLHADFLTLHPITMKEIVWEHDGRLDDPKYVKANYDRISKYASAGFLLGENLIMTGETLKRSIKTETVLKIIEMYYR